MILRFFFEHLTGPAFAALTETDVLISPICNGLPKSTVEKNERSNQLTSTRGRNLKSLVLSTLRKLSAIACCYVFQGYQRLSRLRASTADCTTLVSSIFGAVSTDCYCFENAHLMEPLRPSSSTQKGLEQKRITSA